MRRKKKPTSISFDENSRREFITGFHKRKVERRKNFNEKLERELKEAKRRIKLKAREMTKKITNMHQEGEDVQLPVFQKYYELPEHVVQVRELFPSDVPRDEETITGNDSESECDYDANINGESKMEEDTVVSGMQLNSIRSMKKIVSKQSAALMRQEKAFRKMNKIERAKNRKEAAKKKKSSMKGRKSRKGKR